MRIKRLEVQGFKSFKDKTVIYFDHSITGIVGPNGCGKSNIVDAFFWVMGEQSYKHMRGSSSEDLIFSGSSKYSPMGFAEATLVLETDAKEQSQEPPSGATVRDIPLFLHSKEVAVTRRVYRTGEGEYYINGISVRLKDVQELFMDTGVGAKGYSVVEQGQIGKIVNAKPEERRLLIEEAAGIAKYKARKKESLRKIELAEQNLARLTDILQEIEKTLHTLERQAQKARLYRKYKDDLFNKEMTWGRRKRKVLDQRIDAIKKEKEMLSHEIIALRTEIQIAETQTELDRIESLHKVKQTEELQLKVQELSQELTQNQSALDLSRKRQEDLLRQIENQEKEKTSLKNEIQIDQDKYFTQKEKTQKEDLEFQSLAEQAKAFETTLREKRNQIENIRKTVDISHKEQLAKLSQSGELSSKASSISSKLESFESLNLKLENQILELKEKNKTALQAKDETNRLNQTAQESQNSLKKELQAYQAEIRTDEEALKKAEKDKEESSKNQLQIKSRLESLEELEHSREGFGEGPKAYLNWAKQSQLENDLKPLLDLLEIQRGYETCLHGWLRGRLECLVASSDEVLLQALRAQELHEKGNAWFMLWEAQKSPLTFNQVKTELESFGFEVVGELTEFVKTKEISANSFISQVCVVKNLRLACSFPLEKLRALGWSIVSLNGDCIDQHGFLKLGSLEATNTALLLQRKKAIQELLLNLEEADNHLKLTEQKWETLRTQLDEKYNHSKQIHAKIQVLEIQLATLSKDLEQAAQVTFDVELQIELLHSEIRKIQNDKEAAQKESAELLQKIELIQERAAEIEKEVHEKERDLLELEEGIQDQEKSLSQLKTQESESLEKIHSLKNNLDSLEVLIGERQRRALELNVTIEKTSEECEKIKAVDHPLQKKTAELLGALSNTQSELSAEKDTIEKIHLKIQEKASRIKEARLQIDEKGSLENQYALDSEKFLVESSYLIQSLEEKYGLGCFDISIQEEMDSPIITLEMTTQEETLLGEEVEKLRERIRRLGEVNVMAIDEYDELKKRYDHLGTEKKDLEQSIVNLKDAIEFINKTSLDRFKKAFEAISDRFEKLFPIIFGGGQASLALVYPDGTLDGTPEGTKDILEAGVDILAQPPGKKITNITLLSGGEKALTAVCLIFAIFMIKPSPFCVLDEVDAPLDDANIGKFNALLREMATKSQFILITHNKKTMELNDTLYGVTMEEPGVSKMVSIQLT